VSLTAHLVTDRRRFGLSVDALIDRLTDVARRGVTTIQIRERDLPDRDLVALVRRVLDAVAATPAAVIVNDRVDVALAAGARGVHLRGDSVPGARVRRIVPAGFLIGQSVHSVAEVDRVVTEGGCDYLFFGTVFPSAGKSAGQAVAGVEALREACGRSPLPIMAIGGVDESRLAIVENAGAAGFAAVGMFM
jgi:thiamine-phosphate pyrophosphorylase